MKKFAGVLFVFFVAIQFYNPYKKPPTTYLPKDDFVIFEKVPQKIAAIIKTACYDCHSQKPNLRLYDNVAPVSWYIERNIQKAKRSLNFSKWGRMEDWQRRVFLQGGIVYDIETDRMPPRPYLLMHPDAKISKKDIKLLKRWTSGLDLR